MKILMLSILMVILVNFSNAQITFTEVMFDPSGNESHDEFVEIFNLSYADSADITGWQFSDSAGVDEIIPYRGGNKIPPRSFAIILDASYFISSTTYDSIIPDSVLILTISNSTFGSGGLSNSREESLSLCDAFGDTLTAYRYSLGNMPGYSDEKIIVDELNDTDNWRNSNVENGTPGFKNSVSPFTIDPGFQENSIQIPTVIYDSDSVTISVDVSNLGSEGINSDIELIVYSDRDEDFIFTDNDILIDKKIISQIETFEKTTILINCSNMPCGEHLIVTQIECTEDENLENNSVWVRVNILSKSSDLHINEIKFLTFSGEPEWVELINSGSLKIFLKGWAIADTTITASIDSSVFISPGQIKVISAGQLSSHYTLPDSIIIELKKSPSLNDDEDQVRLIDPDGEVVEKIDYNMDWLEGEKNRSPSLERINPNLNENKSENWGPCVSSFGATPGERNSIFSELTQRETKVDITPNPFSPDGDGFDDYAVISGELPEKSARIKIQIFDIKGRLIRTLKDNRFTGACFNIVWDGKDKNGRVARMGIYIVFVQALNDREGVIREMKSTVVLAHRL